MKSVFIIGNGFNCFFSAYLNNPLYKEEIMEKLFDACPNKWISMKWYKETKGLLNEYCHLLDDIKIADANVNGEFLYQGWRIFVPRWKQKRYWSSWKRLFQIK